MDPEFPGRRVFAIVTSQMDQGGIFRWGEGGFVFFPMIKEKKRKCREEKKGKREKEKK